MVKNYFFHFHFVKKSFFLFSLFFQFSIFAQFSHSLEELLQSEMATSYYANSQRDKSFSFKEDYLKIGLLADSTYYLSHQKTYFDRGINKDRYSSLTFSLDYQWRSIFDGRMRVKNQLAVDEETNYFLPYELYGGWQSKKWKFWFGRKIYSWNEADELYQRGLFQGRFTIDKFNQESYGLSGFFLEKHWASGEWLAFISPIYIPEMGAHYEIKEGTFSSSNPFFNSPSPYVNFLGVNTQLRYKVIEPVDRDIIFHPSYAVMFLEKWGPLFFRSSYAYKPMNQLLFGAQFYFQHTEVGEQEIHVKVYPRLQYHHLLSLEFGHYERGGVHSWINVTTERPEPDQVPSDWTYQQTGLSTIFSAYLGHDILVTPINETQIYLSYSQVFGGDREDGGEITAKSTLFNRRFEFYRVLSLGLRGGYLSWWDRPLNWNTRLLYDEVQAGILFFSDASYYFSKKLALQSSLKLVGILDTKKSEFLDGYLGKYRANDRVDMGLKYVF